MPSRGQCDAGATAQRVGGELLKVMAGVLWRYLQIRASFDAFLTALLEELCFETAARGIGIGGIPLAGVAPCKVCRREANQRYPARTSMNPGSAGDGQL